MKEKIENHSPRYDYYMRKLELADKVTTAKVELLNAIEYFNGITNVAKLLKVARQNVWNKLTIYNISPANAKILEQKSNGIINAQKLLSK
jgi:hypothetical protein